MLTARPQRCTRRRKLGGSKACRLMASGHATLSCTPCCPVTPPAGAGACLGPCVPLHCTRWPVRVAAPDGHAVCTASPRYANQHTSTSPRHLIKHTLTSSPPFFRSFLLSTPTSCRPKTVFWAAVVCTCLGAEVASQSPGLRPADWPCTWLPRLGPCRCTQAPCTECLHTPHATGQLALPAASTTGMPSMPFSLASASDSLSSGLAVTRLVW